jgi:ABC-type multidrug transport system ATPase subunit
MHRYGLYERRDHYVHEESKGTLRKIQIIIAILMSPRVFLADEPLDGVDECGKRIFYEDTQALSAERGTITIYSLHDESALKEHCDEIIYL